MDDLTDIIFVDAISTGYSQTGTGRKSRAVPRSINRGRRLFLGFHSPVHSRGTSAGIRAKYLIGESYGTTRSAELSGDFAELRHEIYLDGIVLVSTVAFRNVADPDARVLFPFPGYATMRGYFTICFRRICTKKRSTKLCSRRAILRMVNITTRSREGRRKPFAADRQKTIGADSGRAFHTGFRRNISDEAQHRVSLPSVVVQGIGTQQALDDGPHRFAF